MADIYSYIRFSPPIIPNKVYAENVLQLVRFVLTVCHNLLLPALFATARSLQSYNASLGSLLRPRPVSLAFRARNHSFRVTVRIIAYLPGVRIGLAIPVASRLSNSSFHFGASMFSPNSNTGTINAIRGSLSPIAVLVSRTKLHSRSCKPASGRGARTNDQK